MKKNDLSKSIINTIKKICFGNSINLHEPLFFGKEYDYLKDCITSTYVSSSGNYISKFEKKLKNSIDRYKKEKWSNVWEVLEID